MGDQGQEEIRGIEARAQGAEGRWAKRYDRGSKRRPGGQGSRIQSRSSREKAQPGESKSAKQVNENRQRPPICIVNSFA